MLEAFVLCLLKNVTVNPFSSLPKSLKDTYGLTSVPQ